MRATGLRAAAVAMPGTCGELVQGALDGVTFLVSCPIDRFATVSVALRPGPGERSPGDLAKAHLAARLALDHFGRRDLAAEIEVRSELTRGKGLGSSTADVAGTIHAVALALGQDIAPLEVARLALRVEPSDGSMFPGLAVFDHREGRRYEPLGVPPPIDVVILDLGGEVDTLAFNGVDRSAILRQNEVAVAEALSLLRRGVADWRPDLIGRAATLSARANQRVLFKPELPAVEDLVNELGALGVCVGHSGTVIGILIDAAAGDAPGVARIAQASFPTLQDALVHRVLGGGCRPASVLS